MWEAEANSQRDDSEEVEVGKAREFVRDSEEGADGIGYMVRADKLGNSARLTK